MGISLSKAINKIKIVKGAVYKHRYHFRKITSTRQLKNVLHYIFNNGVHHKRSSNILDPFNSLPAEVRLDDIYKAKAKKIKADIENSLFLKKLSMELKGVLDGGRVYFQGLKYVVDNRTKFELN